jgi:hypothetical protein
MISFMMDIIVELRRMQVGIPQKRNRQTLYTLSESCKGHGGGSRVR